MGHIIPLNLAGCPHIPYYLSGSLSSPNNLVQRGSAKPQSTLRKNPCKTGRLRSGAVRACASPTAAPFNGALVSLQLPITAQEQHCPAEWKILVRTSTTWEASQKVCESLLVLVSFLGTEAMRMGQTLGASKVTVAL